MSRAASGTSWGPAQRERERELIALMGTLPPDDPGRAAARDEVVTMHMALVHHLARRYRERGESYDDLVQVGTIGLIKAVDRFEPERGLEFSTYATPLILGEIKRHFRDRTWSVRMPRRLQEVSARVTQAADELTAELDRSPTVGEIAERIGCTSEEVLEGLEARRAYAADSLDSDADENPGTAARIGLEDADLAAVEDREAVRALLESLPEREREIVILRFYQNLSQSQIADRVGVSQMHVSRLLAKSLATMRESLA